MTPFTTRIPRRLAALALGTIGALAVAPSALAGPTTTMPSFTWDDNAAVIRSGPAWVLDAGAGRVTRDQTAVGVSEYGVLQRCAPEGFVYQSYRAGTRRTHSDAQQLTEALVTIAPNSNLGGEFQGILDSAYTQNAWDYQNRTFPVPTQCLYAGVRTSATKTTAASTAPRKWEFNLTNVVVEDTVGPSADLRDIPGGYIMGGQFDFNVGSTDNAQYEGFNWGHTTLGLFDANGSLVANPDMGLLGSGVHPASLTTSGYADGTYTLRAYRAATAWATAESAAATISIDNAAPSAPTASGHSTAWTNYARTITIGTASTDGSGIAGYEYTTNNGATWQAGSSYTHAGQGEVNVAFRGVDNAGRVSASSNIASVRVDTIAPTTSNLTSTLITGDNSQRRVSYTLGDSGGSQIAEARLEAEFTKGQWTVVDRFNPPFGATTGPFTRTIATDGFPEGRHAYRLVVTDNAGNATTTNHGAGALDSLVIDRTAPKSSPPAKAQIISYPHARVTWDVTDANGVEMDAATAGSNVFIEVEASPGVWVEKYAGRTGLGAGSATFSVDDLPAGGHDVRIRFMDRVGNTKLEAAEGQVVNDVAPPAITSTRFSLHGTDPSKAIITFTFDDGSDGSGPGVNHPAIVSCSTDGTNWTPLNDINADGAPLLTDGANRHVIDTTDCPEGTGMWMRLSVADAAGNRTVKVYAPGDAAFSDLPGGGFVVDRTAPQITGATLTPATDGSGKAKVGFTITEPSPSAGVSNTKNARVEILDKGTGTWVTVCTVPVATGASSIDCDMGAVTDQQRTRYRILVPDSAGNIATHVGAQASVIIDRTGPTITPSAIDVPGRPLESGLTDRQVRALVNINDNQPIGVGVNTAGGATTLEGQLPDGTWVSLGTPAAVQGDQSLTGTTTPMQEGVRRFRLRTHDLYGNATTHILGEAIVDHSAPVFSGDERAFQLPGSRALVKFGATDTGVGFRPDHRYRILGRINGGAWQTLGYLSATTEADLEKTVDVSQIGDGTVELAVQATDAGGRAATSSPMRLLVDQTPPTIGSPGNPGSGLPSVTYPGPRAAHVCWVLSDADGSGFGTNKVLVEMRMPDGSWRTVANPPATPGESCIDIDLTGLPEGQYPIRITVEDQGGNRTTTTAPVVVDSTAPAIAITGLGVSQDQATAILNYRISDGTGSGVDPATVRVQVAPGDLAGQPIGDWRDLHAIAVNPDSVDQQATLQIKDLEKRAWAVRVLASDKQANPGASSAHGMDLRPIEARVADGSSITPDTKAIQKANSLDTLVSVRPLAFRVTYPKPKAITIAGRFAAPDGGSLGGQRLRVIEYGVNRAEVITDPTGAFTFTYTPVASGVARIEFPGNEKVGPIAMTWTVTVTPYLTATTRPRASARTPLVITGTFAPSPALVAGGLPVTTKKGPVKATAPKRGKKSMAKAPKRAPKGKVITGQSVEVFQLSTRACPTLRKALAGARTGRAVPKGIKARCWVGPAPTIGRAVLGPNGRYTVKLKLAQPPTGTYRLYLQVRVPQTQGWPFATAQSRLLVVTVTR